MDVKVYLSGGPLDRTVMEIPRYDSVIYVPVTDAPDVRYNVVYEKVGTALRPARKHDAVFYKVHE